MKKKTVIISILVVALCVGGWYVYSQSRTPQSQEIQLGASSNTGGQPLPSGGMETGTVDFNSLGTSTAPEDNLTVNAYNYGFSPANLTVKKGDHVKITVTNSGGYHDFVIDELNVRTPRLETAASTSVEFDATLAGTFQYYSSVSNQRAMGMFGTLTVTE